MSTDEIIPESQEALAEWLREAAGKPPRGIQPAGGRTALHYGYPLARPFETLCLSKLTQVIDYPARDMTVTVEAGIRLDDLTRLLAKERQRLAVDVSESHRATLGGAVATNTSGPRRFGLGTLRDYVIGVSAVDASGRAFKAGGRVVKNVAGYDLCKVLIGSLGTLAVLTQLTLKLKPIPEATAFLWGTFAGPERLEQALQKLTGSSSRPVALEVLNETAATALVREAGLDLPAARFVLAIGYEGTAREVQWQLEAAKAEISPHQPGGLAEVAGAQAVALWSALIDFAVPADEPLTFKASLRPSATVAFLAAVDGTGTALQAHAGNGVVIGHLADEVTSLAAARSLLEPLRQSARQSQGNLVVLNCDDAWKRELPVFGDPVPAEGLMRSLKTKLDPRDVLNPGRLFRA